MIKNNFWYFVYVGIYFLIAGVSLPTVLAFIAFEIFYTVMTFVSLSKRITGSKYSRKGWVYGFYDFGSLVPAIKIGRSSSEKGRLRSHKTAAPWGILTCFNIQVKDAIHAERQFHDLLQDVRVSNRNEWFYLTPRFLCLIILLKFTKRI